MSNFESVCINVALIKTSAFNFAQITNIRPLFKLLFFFCTGVYLSDTENKAYFYAPAFTSAHLSHSSTDWTSTGDAHT